MVKSMVPTWWGHWTQLQTGPSTLLKPTHPSPNSMCQKWVSLPLQGGWVQCLMLCPVTDKLKNHDAQGTRMSSGWAGSQLYLAESGWIFWPFLLLFLSPWSVHWCLMVPRDGRLGACLLSSLPLYSCRLVLKSNSNSSYSKLNHFSQLMTHSALVWGFDYYKNPPRLHP